MHCDSNVWIIILCLCAEERSQLSEDGVDRYSSFLAWPISTSFACDVFWATNTKPATSKARIADLVIGSAATGIYKFGKVVASPFHRKLKIKALENGLKSLEERDDEEDGPVVHSYLGNAVPELKKRLTNLVNELIARLSSSEAILDQRLRG